MWKTLLGNLSRGPYTDPLVSDRTLRKLSASVNTETRRLFGRGLAIREVDAGSCNGCELELNALNNVNYDIERFGLRFVASPRHADVLLVTGPVTHNMLAALLRTWQAIPNPKWVIAAGECACNCGVFSGSYAIAGRVEDFIPVDIHIPGCPPTPTSLLEGLLMLVSSIT